MDVTQCILYWLYLPAYISVPGFEKSGPFQNGNNTLRRQLGDEEEEAKSTSEQSMPSSTTLTPCAAGGEEEEGEEEEEEEEEEEDADVNDLRNSPRFRPMVRKSEE